MLNYDFHCVCRTTGTICFCLLPSFGCCLVLAPKHDLVLFFDLFFYIFENVFSEKLKMKRQKQEKSKKFKQKRKTKEKPRVTHYVIQNKTISCSSLHSFCFTFLSLSLVFSTTIWSFSDIVMITTLNRNRTELKWTLHSTAHTHNNLYFREFSTLYHSNQVVDWRLHLANKVENG